MLGVLIGFTGWGSLHAQEDPVAVSGKPSWLITPSASTSLTVTDNARPGQGQKQSDVITSVTPAIRIDGKGGRVSGNLNFSWQQNFYAKESAFNNNQKFMNATGKAELVDQWLFLDASGIVAQQPNSAFGTQNVGNELVNNNRGSTTSYQWSPYIQGYLGGSVDYELRYRNSQTTTNTGVYSTGGGVDTQAWTGRLSGNTPLMLLGWSLSAEDQRVDFSARETRSNRSLGTLEYRVDPQVKLNVSAGQESDNYNNFNMRNRSVSGYGVDWAPTERTKLSLKKERRSFGDGHNFSFEHRTALTAWKIIDSRSVVVPAQQFTTAPVSTAYDLFYSMSASDPLSRSDPVARALATTALLQSLNIPANSLIYGNIMTSQPFIQRQQQASVSLTGVNNTVTFSAQRSSNQSIGSGVSTLDDFALSRNIRQSGLSGSWAHKLSPESSLTLNALTSTSKAETATLETRLRSLSLLYSRKLGIRTTASLGLRQSDFDSSGAVTTTDYTEHAITGTLSASF